MDCDHRRKSSASSDDDPFANAEHYYGPSKGHNKLKTRTYSMHDIRSKSDFFNDPKPPLRSNNTETLSTIKSDDDSESDSPPERRPSIFPISNDFAGDSLADLSLSKDGKSRLPPHHLRRGSLDDTLQTPKKYFINDVDQTLNELLANEDTDHNYQITIEDAGPKVLKLGTVNSNGYKHSMVRGTYMLSNLLQELTIAKSMGRNQVILDEARLRENPVHRMRRLISLQFWKSLTREITKYNVDEMSKDTKIEEDYYDENGVHHKLKETRRIYIPHGCEKQYEYFVSAKELCPTLDVQYLPAHFDAEYIMNLNKKPGLLALGAKPDPKNPDNLLNWPYVVPGGRFNELYGWDSYMETLGLLTDVTTEHQEHLLLARGMTENFIYEIKHYGKILNANRSYYLGRSQPPFLTDMALRVFDKTREVAPENLDDSLDFLKRSTLAAIKEYNTVWCCKPRLDEETGLSCYHPEGKGIPPETEPSHFNSILEPYTKKYNVSQLEFIDMYNHDKVHEPDLDEYFLHDRAIRESGHDTSYRLEGKCAYLATVDLNSLLYKYETDIAFIIKTYFNDSLEIERSLFETSSPWLEKAKKRKERVTKYLWNEEDSIFYDYHIKTKKQTGYESATTFWPLWSKVATEEQAEKLVANSVSKFEEFGGLVSGTLKSRGELNIHRPSRQWDYPYGWAPQQILAWIGLCNYNHEGVARRLIYRWLFMMTKAFVDYNGVVVEKYNVTKGAVPHKVDAEYGNQGTDFKGVAREGFGWVNASYLFGLTFMNLHAKRCLDILTSPEDFLKNLSPSQRASYK
ncbi:uncharacterized protein PRCAT00003681001 [Priceomyces carsonii]|uniref:uncharacterized protein n=1 Tax=Priceomyces carsonii TaxID=28549 RepID=UPI002ED8E5FD|nr:unnamed protein product [Priceomyces carsonii]